MEGLLCDNKHPAKTAVKARVIAAIVAHDLETVKTCLAEDFKCVETVVVFASIYGFDDIREYALDLAKVDGSIFYDTLCNVSEACMVASSYLQIEY